MATPTWVTGVLTDLGAPITQNTVTALEEWGAAEGGSGNNWLNTKQKGGVGSSTNANNGISVYPDEQQGINATVETIEQSNMAGIAEAFRKNASPDEIRAAIIASPWSEDHYAGTDYAAGSVSAPADEGASTSAATPTSAELTSKVTTPDTGKAAAGSTAVTVPATQFATPMQGVDVKNFHGFDLSAFVGTDELGNAEKAIQDYVVDPGYAQQIEQRVEQDYGYSAKWIEKLPEVNAVLIWASTSLDLSTAAGKDAFQSMLANTQWWKTSNANVRTWDELEYSDPAQLQQNLANAQEKVLADANQMGVTLTKTELDSIANTYARNTIEQSGALGTQSGTASEWLDQAITDTILNIKNQKAAGLTTDYSTLPTGQSTFAQEVTPATLTAPGATAKAKESPNSLFGIASQLYTDFQNIAQQYLMYNPTDPGKGYLTNNQLLGYVQDALKNYTGTGSSFGSSNLISGAQSQFTDLMKEQATRLYPTMAAPIGQGVTPQSYVAPIQSQISTLLYGSSDYADEINLLSPEWNWAIATPNAKGEKTVLTPDQIQAKVVTTPAYHTSDQAVSNARNFQQNLVSSLGIGA